MRRHLSFEALEPRLPLAVPALQTELVASLSNPVVATHAGDGSGRIFIAEQDGQIRIVDDGSVVAAPFLDISSRVLAGGERGLLGLAFHPDFAEQDAAGAGLFYVYYSAPATMGGNHDSVVAEYAVSAGNPNQADFSSERIVLRFNQPFSNHNGGDLKFGPDDGWLYISSGDGGSGGDPQGNGQNLNTLLGKILRIDVNRGDDFPSDPHRNYAIPPTNPFVSNPAARDEIFAYGLRNPFRMSFDDGPNGAASPDRLFVGDVGQNSFEEVDIVTAGGNYGWNVCEADHVFGNPSQPCPAGFIKPIAEYGRSVGISVIGGFVYRGSQSPSLSGVYLFGDLNGTMLALEEQGGAFALSQPSVTGVVPSNIIGFGQDEAGELYVLTFSQMLRLRAATTVDFGDAPASYRVTQADTGAAHFAIGPRLGDLRDVEADGQPSPDASGDDASGADDEDGVLMTSSMIATSESATRSSVSVAASSAAKLDAWIDFNRDGDWDDAGEQVFTSRNLAAGTNLLGFNVPAGANAGDTFARFRISSAGGLAPTGIAADGEVEDYLVTILDGDVAGGASAEVALPFAATLDVAPDGGEVVVHSGAVELFRAPGSSLNRLDLLGTAGDDTVNAADLDAIFGGLVAADLRGGYDVLRLTGSSQLVDLTQIADADLQGIEEIDITGTGSNSLILNEQEVRNLSATSDTLLVRINDGESSRDTLTLGAGWLTDAPQFIAGETVHQQRQGATFVQVVSDRPWRNPFNAVDTNRDDSVSPVDALAGINTINDAGARALPAPTSALELPELYFDTNGDEFVSPLDVLIVINFLNDALTNAEGEGGGREGWQRMRMPDAVIPDTSEFEGISDTMATTNNRSCSSSDTLNSPAMGVDAIPPSSHSATDARFSPHWLVSRRAQANHADLVDTLIAVECDWLTDWLIDECC